MIDWTKSFIEEQFPVSKVSKEAYKERKANQGQTLTGLGKWWGRKPLVLVRATILGILLPVSDDKQKDKEIFLKIMTMDDEGLWLRKNKNISTKDLFLLCSETERKKYFTEESTKEKPKLRRKADLAKNTYVKATIQEKEDYFTEESMDDTPLFSKDGQAYFKLKLQRSVFSRLSYDEKLVYCRRPEHVEITAPEEWGSINTHLQTTASSLQELVEQLGVKKFGHRPRIGDCFAGGGSIPFEAARMGAEAYGSDLNPVASLLTWSSLNIAGSLPEELKHLLDFRQSIYDKVEKQVTEWGIEQNAGGERANSYLYCSETICPEENCGYKVPLSPSWVVGKGTKTIVQLVKDEASKRFNFTVVEGASKEQIKAVDAMKTTRDKSMWCPNCKRETSISSLRGGGKDQNNNAMYGLRLWSKDEFIPQKDDVFQERLYCIRYVRKDGSRYYHSPNLEEEKQEQKIVEILQECFSDWQEKGFFPSTEIEEGDETTRLKRERGWKYWHQLYNPRQLLLNGLFLKMTMEYAKSQEEIAICCLGMDKIVDWNSKLCIWNVGAGTEKTQNTFTTHSLNTMYNYGARSSLALKDTWFFTINNSRNQSSSEVQVTDARSLTTTNDLWITDPPYADAVNYHELSELFLAWNNGLIRKAFPKWYTDSKRVLAVKGKGQSFNKSMVEVYENLREHMPDNGFQVVMFTHQSTQVWAELTMILWKAGLQVISAWNIATETESGGLKSGNYVKGTVILVLKKQTSDETGYEDEALADIEDEVEEMILSMRDLDTKDNPDFSDPDYILAAYAASLKVLTSYKKMDKIDTDFWLSQASSADNPINELIEKAKKLAYRFLIPEGFDQTDWNDLSSDERFYIQGLSLEMANNYSIGSYQELARGFGIKEYKPLLASTKANESRLKTPEEFRMTMRTGDGFGGTLLRHVLIALNETVQNDSTAKGIHYLKLTYNEGMEYWDKKPLMMIFLRFLEKTEFVDNMKHWNAAAKASKLLKMALSNDGL